MDEKSAVFVIVYRDRPGQIGEFLEVVGKHLDSLDFNWRIIIAEQCPDTPFNRGLLINLGYKSARSLFPEFKYTVFTDVDIYPVDRQDTLDYTGKPGAVRHIFCGYEQNIGGCVNFDNEMFERINGFPNHLWGWGHEDYAAKKRLDLVKVSVDRSTTVYRDRPEDAERFRMYDHDRDKKGSDVNRNRAYRDLNVLGGLSTLPKYEETRIRLSDKIVRCLYYFNPKIVF